MSFASEASKLLTNKYFLYFIVFLAVSNVLGYLVTNKLNAVIFFALICLLMANFSKNMVVILIIAIVATNLLMANKSMREGLENPNGLTDEQKAEINAEVQTDVQAIKNKRAATAAAPVEADTTTTDPTTSSTAVDSTATPVATTTTTATTPTSATAAAAELKAKAQARQTTDTTTTTTAPVVDEGFAPAGVGSSGNKRGAIGGPAKPSRIDYATTLEDAYDNLDKILGSGGMQNLSADTEKLMGQQQKLFTAMNSMMPLVSKAQDMLQGLDMGKIGQMVNMTKSFGSAKAQQ